MSYTKYIYDEQMEEYMEESTLVIKCHKIVCKNLRHILRHTYFFVFSKFSFSEDASLLLNCKIVEVTHLLVRRLRPDFLNQKLLIEHNLRQAAILTN